jgi:hypothetical protein
MSFMTVRLASSRTTRLKIVTSVGLLFTQHTRHL